MRKPKLILKLAAACSSALLVAAFVSYRAGAFTGTPSDPADATSDSTEQKPEPSSPGSSEEQFLPLSPPESISEKNNKPDAARPHPPVQRQPTIFSGTKSASPSVFINGLKPANSTTPDLDIPLTPLPGVVPAPRQK